MKYQVIDIQTGNVIREYDYKNRVQARRLAEQKDQEYGSHRYYCIMADARRLK